jgi:regulator of sirC expression with transglutaminase-like and TPR domain
VACAWWLDRSAAVARYRWGVEATERFAELVAGPSGELPLDTVSLLIAQHARPDLDVDRELGLLDDLASSCPTPTLDGLVTHLFHDLGFAGNAADYYDPRNSYLDQVVARRLGIPITLSVLAIVVGRRLGVPLAGVGMPGHFLLRDRVDPAVFVDPFGGGSLLDREACAAIFRSLHGPDATFDERFLDPVPPQLVVARMLANLRSVFISRGDRSSMLWVLRLRTLLPGASPEDRADLAGCLAATGRFGEAAREYDHAALGLGGSLGEELSRNAARLRARLN